MTRDSAVHRYGKLSITLHWLMLALFVGVYGCIEIKGLLPVEVIRGAFHGASRLIRIEHFCVGLGPPARASHAPATDYPGPVNLADRRLAPNARRCMC